MVQDSPARRGPRFERAPAPELEKPFMGYPTQRGISLYCVSCGRSTEVTVAPAKPGRCTTCGGTMMTEHLA